MSPAEALINAPEFTVSELSSALKRTVEDAYGHVRVRGEITGFRGAHSSGHCYFALKDDGAKIEAVIWKGVHSRMRFKPQEGLEVIATGKLTTYPGSSKYQIVIEAIEPAGIGALMALMEERKRKLAAEGLFDAARKQLLPWLPEVIGVVTSPTGAVIRDILHRLQDRFPRRVLVWPVKVQGEGSAEQVAAAIRGFNALPVGGKTPRPDLLIVARGGGSLEDLWSFNEEIVVRAAAESMIPLISAVGHETDITLIDFAADKRAPTPTAAAEMAVPVRAELFVEVSTLARRVMVCWQRGQEGRRNELRAAVRALPAAGELLAIPRQRPADIARAARPGRAGQAAADGLRRTDDPFRKVAAAKPPRSFLGARGSAQGLKALQRASATPDHRARPRTRAAPGRARAARADHDPAAPRGAGHPQRTIAGGAVVSQRADPRLRAGARRARPRRPCRGRHRPGCAARPGICRRARRRHRGCRSAGCAGAAKSAEDGGARSKAGNSSNIQARCQTGRPGKPVLAAGFSSPRPARRQAYQFTLKPPLPA